MYKVDFIRKEEKRYHDDLYKNHKLFEPGSWLYKPVQTVLDVLETFSDYSDLTVLDLGSGVGRNSIPIAESLKHRTGRVVCIDILDSSIENLISYSKEYNVDKFIETFKTDIESFYIKPLEYDLIVSVSALEHVSSATILEAKLEEMVKGTKTNGVNCIIISSEIEEFDKETNEKLDPLFEVNLPSDEMIQMLESKYYGWSIERQHVMELEFSIERSNKPVQLISKCVTFVAKKS